MELEAIFKTRRLPDDFDDYLERLQRQYVIMGWLEPKPKPARSLTGQTKVVAGEECANECDWDAWFA